MKESLHHLVAQDEGDELFARVMAQLKVHVGNEAYSSWFGRLQLDEFSRSQVRLSASGMSNTIASRYCRARYESGGKTHRYA